MPFNITQSTAAGSVANYDATGLSQVGETTHTPNSEGAIGRLALKGYNKFVSTVSRLVYGRPPSKRQKAKERGRQAAIAAKGPGSRTVEGDLLGLETQVVASAEVAQDDFTWPADDCTQPGNSYNQTLCKTIQFSRGEGVDERNVQITLGLLNGYEHETKAEGFVKFFHPRMMSTFSSIMEGQNISGEGNAIAYRSYSAFSGAVRIGIRCEAGLTADFFYHLELRLNDAVDEYFFAIKHSSENVTTTTTTSSLRSKALIGGLGAFVVLSNIIVAALAIRKFCKRKQGAAEEADQPVSNDDIPTTTDLEVGHAMSDQQETGTHDFSDSYEYYQTEDSVYSDALATTTIDAIIARGPKKNIEQAYQSPTAGEDISSDSYEHYGTEDSIGSDALATTTTVDAILAREPKTHIEHADRSPTARGHI